MRIDVFGNNVVLTDAIRAHAQTKAEKLTRFWNGIQQITFRISREDHQHRPTYNVELVVDVVRHDDLVCRAKGEDLYTTIDEAVRKGERLVADHKDRLRSH
jgi:putative sigma-54 modulation protein